MGSEVNHTNTERGVLISGRNHRRFFKSCQTITTSGPVQGFILKLPVFGTPPDTHCFEDSVYWEVSWGVTL